MSNYEHHIIPNPKPDNYCTDNSTLNIGRFLWVRQEETDPEWTRYSTCKTKKVSKKISTSENTTVSVLYRSNSFISLCIGRRIKTEETAKVVASVWGAEFFNFLAAQADLLWTS